MKKSFLVTLGFAAVITASLAFTADEPIYKNLKILPKNITKEQIDSVMHHYTASLNVKCNFCHIRNEEKKEWDFASDANKHKRIARDMMRMTNKINDNYFTLTGAKRDLNTQLMVTCYTCHRGSKEPVTKAPPHEKIEEKIMTDSTKRNQ